MLFMEAFSILYDKLSKNQQLLEEYANKQKVLVVNSFIVLRNCL